MGYEVSVEVSKCIEEVSELILFIFFLIFSDTLPIRYRRSIGVSKYRIRIGIRVRQVSEVSVQPRPPAPGERVHRRLQRLGIEHPNVLVRTAARAHAEADG